MASFLYAVRRSRSTCPSGRTKFFGAGAKGLCECQVFASTGGVSSGKEGMRLIDVALSEANVGVREKGAGVRMVHAFEDPLGIHEFTIVDQPLRSGDLGIRAGQGREDAGQQAHSVSRDCPYRLCSGKKARVLVSTLSM